MSASAAFLSLAHLHHHPAARFDDICMLEFDHTVKGQRAVRTRCTLHMAVLVCLKPTRYKPNCLCVAAKKPTLQAAASGLVTLQA